MPVVDPLNDKFCLGKAHAAAAAFRETPECRELAARLGTVENLTEYVRNLPFRVDLGDPADGPHIQCDVLQRLRLSPTLMESGRSCFEGTALFLAMAPLIEPRRVFTSVTSCVNGQMHTNPVELIRGRPVSIDIDPYESVPANVRNGALYAIGTASPLTGGHLALWFDDLVRDACVHRNARQHYQLATESLCHAIVYHRRRISQPHALGYALRVAGQDAPLFGPLGQIGYDRMVRSIRNLSKSLDDQSVSKYLDKLTTSAQPMAGDIIKAALIAQFGPAAAFALRGRKLGLSALTDKSKKKLTIAQGVQATGKRKPTREECRQLARRMSPAFFLARK